MISAKQKVAVLRRDEYRCVFCGLSEKAGIKLHIVPILPDRYKNKTTADYFQTLCTKHKDMTIKDMFTDLSEMAKEEDDEELGKFSEEVLAVYDKHGMDSHIKRKK